MAQIVTLSSVRWAAQELRALCIQKPTSSGGRSITFEVKGVERLGEVYLEGKRAVICGQS